MKKILRLLLAALLSGGIVISLRVLGILIFPSAEFRLWALIVAVLLLLLLCAALIFNAVTSKKHVKKMASPDYKRETIAMMNELVDQPEAAATEYYQKLKKDIRQSKLYFWCSFACGLLLAFLPIGGSAYPYPYTAVIAVFLLMNLFTRALPLFEKEKIEFQKEEEYPHLYGMMRKAQQETGGNRKLYLLIDSSDNVSIASKGQKAYLVISALLLNILTEQELYQVLLHEFAHLQDTEGERLGRRMNSKRKNIWFAACDMKEAYDYSFYSLFASKECERKADRMIREKGDTTSAASAFAKLAYLGYYEGGFFGDAQTTARLFEKEDAPAKDYYTHYLSCFLKSVSADPTLYRTTVEKEIETRMASHPIARVRIEALGIQDYGVSFEAPVGKYGAEVKKALAEIDREIFDDISENYAERRQNCYLEPLSVIEEFKKKGEPLTYEDTREVLEALMYFCRYEEIFELSKKMREKGLPEAEMVHAIYYEGLARLRMRDESGIDLIYKAIEINSNYFNEGYEATNNYIVTMGLTERREEYLAHLDEVAEQAVDHSELSELRAEDCLEKCPEDLPFFKSNLDFLLSEGEDVIEEVYLVKKIISEKTYCYTYLICYKKNADPGRCADINHAMFMYLDKQEEQYSLVTYTPNMKFLKDYRIYKCDKKGN